MAEAIFNLHSKGVHHASSAGTKVFNKEGVSMEGEKLKDREGAKEVIAVLKELGIDARESKRNQLHEEMLVSPDIVVVMAEENTLPDYLKNNSKVRYWDIADPKGADREQTAKLRDQIAQKVDELLVEINTKE
jgi:protein-tyrosine-phosphatase